jgi:hypothetical protein
VEIQAVGRDFTLTAWHGKAEKSQLVVISSAGLGIISIVTEKIKDVKPPLKMIM